MSDKMLIVPDHSRPDWSKASSLARGLLGQGVVVKRTPGLIKIASMVMRLKNQTGIVPAGMRPVTASGKKLEPDPKYAARVIHNVFENTNPYSAASSRDQTPRDTTSKTQELDDFDSIVHEVVVHPDPAPAPEPEQKPEPVIDDLMEMSDPPKKPKKKSSHS